MKRIALTDRSGRWFDSEKAELIKEELFWDGNNWISRATGSQWEHEWLYRTRGGKWILNHWSNFQGVTETYIEINNKTAAAWLASQTIAPHADCVTEFNELEIQ